MDAATAMAIAVGVVCVCVLAVGTVIALKYNDKETPAAYTISVTFVCVLLILVASFCAGIGGAHLK